MDPTREQAKEDVLQVFEFYLAETAHLDPARLERFYALPCLLVSSQAVVAMSSEETLKGVLGHHMAALKGQGFLRTQLDRAQVRLVATDLAIISADLSRCRAGGEIDRVGGTYLFRVDRGEWKITSAVIHEYGASVGGSA